jgi:hypothetical protein
MSVALFALLKILFVSCARFRCSAELDRESCEIHELTRNRDCRNTFVQMPLLRREGERKGISRETCL